ncbi:DUF3108 domain-containing protein [Roseovarius amoyensis]|uniref:DUF3108 domain-containing protein n=1 Tax=Roseovarius amoyensis TaxID=2211448 RepID=UPI0013A6E7C6|nr:DUF3108 domain-containing protein [Roseovarius amoyensis]
MRVAAIFVLLLLPFAGSAGEQSSMRFDVRLLGLRAGVIEIGANVTNGGYAARSHFKTAGLVGVLRRLRANVTVQGMVAGGDLRPHDYTEAIDDGRRVTDVHVRFAPGQPRLVAGDTGSSAPPADTSGLRNAIDPLTLLYIALRDQPRDEVCRFKADVFDGHRHAVITLDRRRAEGDAIVCDGAYRRVAGYSEIERRSSDVDISVTYVPAGNTMRAERVAFDTRLGPAVMERR